MQTTLTPVSGAELRERIAAGTAFVLDVRTPGEFETEHIAGSYNVPLDTLKEHVADVAGRVHEQEHDAVLVCASGVRAADAQRRLAEAGVERATVLTGGISAYAQAGGDVVRRGTGWSLERQVRFVAGSIVLVGAVASQIGSRRCGLIPAGIGTGLVFSSLTDTCAMGSMLARMPWNRVSGGAADAAALLGGPDACPVERARRA